MDAMTAKPPLKILAAPRPDHGITPERFAAKIRPSDFKKIEVALELPSPSADIRQSLTLSLFAFYKNSLPNTPKKDMERIAALSSELAELTTKVYKSGDWAAIAALGKFAQVSMPSQYARPMHESGVGLVDVLNEYSFTAGWLADTRPNDKGGNRPALAFDNLTKEMASRFCQRHPGRWWIQCAHSKIEAAPTSPKEPFFWLMWAVVEVLRDLDKKLPAPTFDLPKTHDALKMRLHRLKTAGESQ